MPASEHEHRSKTALRDAEWVMQIRLNGDRSAYTRLMEAYFEKVFSRMLKMTGNTSDAEDLAMESFTRAFSRIDSYTNNYPFSSWLFSIARNHAIDFLRQRRNESDPMKSDNGNEQNGLQFEVPDHVPGPDQQLIVKQETQLLRELVETLPAKYRDILKLHYFDDLAIDEIAGNLNMPVNTVKIRLFRARALLAAIYASPQRH